MRKRCFFHQVSQGFWYLNTYSGHLNSNSGNVRKVFKSYRNGCSSTTRKGVQALTEWAFKWFRNMHLSQAEKTGAITITDGTKGGRTRTIDIVSIEQLTALKQAANIQGSDHCLIPKEQNYREYRNQAYQEAYQAGLPGFHGHRHEYAQNRYEQLTGQACPVVAGVLHNTHHQYLANQLNVSVSDARSIDYAARMQIAQELGHGRIDITNSYLG